MFRFTRKVIGNRADCNIQGTQFYRLHYNTFGPVQYLYCNSFPFSSSQVATFHRFSSPGITMAEFMNINKFEKLIESPILLSNLNVVEGINSVFLIN